LLARSIFVLPAMFVSATATAQVERLVITGSRLPVTPSGLAQNVTVIDQQQIQESAPARLEDLLGRIGGVYVDQAGKTGGFSSLYIRGAENSHLLVMIDGVKVNDPTTTRGSAYDLSSIDVHQVERIEVLRGPASAIHGGEALAGVVNIITKRSTGPGLGGSAYGAAGQQGHRKLGASVTAGSGVLRGQLSVGHSREGSSGDDVSLRLNTFSGSLRVTPNALVEGEVFVHRAERKSDAFPDDSGGPRLAVNRELTRRDASDIVYGASVTAGDASLVRFQAGVSVYERDEDADNAFVDPGVRFPVPAFTNDTNFRRTTAHATATHNWGNDASLVVGLERQSETGDLTSVGDFDFDGSPESLHFGLERRTDSVFAEGRLHIARSVSLQIGVRHDKVQGLDAQTTPHLGAVWDLPNGATTLKASYSKGFKPPSFFALGFPIGGNPDLRPERSKNAELTLVHRLDAHGSSIEASAFRIDYTDLIDFDASTFSNVNRGTVVVKGLEPTLKLRLADRLRTQLGFTLLDIREQDGLAPLRNRPEKRATAALVYEIDARSSLFAGASYTGTYLDRSNPTGDIVMPGYTTVDLAYSILWRQVRAKLAVDNLLDRQYEQFVGFPALDRRVRVEVRVDF
jgi:iron complex outermembrane receptor protein/vitamin B12 transporter